MGRGEERLAGFFKRSIVQAEQSITLLAPTKMVETHTNTGSQVPLSVRFCSNERSAGRKGHLDLQGCMVLE